MNFTTSQFLTSQFLTKLFQFHSYLRQSASFLLTHEPSTTTQGNITRKQINNIFLLNN